VTPCFGLGQVVARRPTATWKNCACQEPSDECRNLKKFLQARMFGALLFVVVVCRLDPGWSA